MFRKLRQLFRLAAYTQLMPALESADDPLIGGQAVLEGVMMRAPHSYCIAVRKPDGEITTQEGEAIRLSEKNKLWGLPVVRGVATLFQAMSLGIKALNFSAQFVEDDEEDAKKGEDDKPKELPKWMIVLNIVFSLGFMIFLYKFLPLTATKLIQAVHFYRGAGGFATNINPAKHHPHIDQHAAILIGADRYFACGFLITRQAKAQLIFPIRGQGDIQGRSSAISRIDSHTRSRRISTNDHFAICLDQRYRKLLVFPGNNSDVFLPGLETGLADF